MDPSNVTSAASSEADYLNRVRDFLLNDALVRFVQDSAQRQALTSDLFMNKYWVPSFTSPTVAPDSSKNYENLETLGDATLKGSFVRYLFKRAPNQDSLFYTEIPNLYMSKEKQHIYGYALGLDKYVRIRGLTEPTQRMMTDIFESFVGALYSSGEDLIPGYGGGLVYSLMVYLFSDEGQVRIFLPKKEMYNMMYHQGVLYILANDEGIQILQNHGIPVTVSQQTEYGKLIGQLAGPEKETRAATWSQVRSALYPGGIFDAIRAVGDKKTQFLEYFPGDNKPYLRYTEGPRSHKYELYVSERQYDNIVRSYKTINATIPPIGLPLVEYSVRNPETGRFEKIAGYKVSQAEGILKEETKKIPYEKAFDLFHDLGITRNLKQSLKASKMFSGPEMKPYLEAARKRLASEGFKTMTFTTPPKSKDTEKGIFTLLLVGKSSDKTETLLARIYPMVPVAKEGDDPQETISKKMERARLESRVDILRAYAEGEK